MYEESNFHPAFVWAVNQALAECPGASVGSGFRTIEEQTGLLWKRDQGISVADPGYSRHNGAENLNGGIEGASGGAVDMQGDLECFARAGAKYGLTNLDVPDELWHFQFTDEAWQAVMDGTYAGGEFGMTEEAAVEPAEPSLASIRDRFYGRITPGGQDRGPLFAPEPQARAAAAAPTEAPTDFVPEASAGFSGGGEPMSAVDVAKVYAQAGFTGDALVTMVAIARGESGWDPDIRGDTSITTGTWGPSIGLSQIRSLNAEAGTGGWRDPQRLSDPLFNAKAAFAISNGGTNFGPWTVYSKGIYQQYVEEAKRAVSALGTGSYRVNDAPTASMEPEDGGLGLDPTARAFDPVGLSRSIADDLLAVRREQQQDSPLERAGLKRKPEEEVA